MKPDELIAQAHRITKDAQSSAQSGEHGGLSGNLSEASEFVRQYAGEQSSFYQNLLKVDQFWGDGIVLKHIRSNLEAFAHYVENGLLGGISIQQQARVDVVSDFLTQAQDLLQTPDVHPAGAAMIIGASLEEYLRAWVEEAGLALGNKKPSIDTYATTLREASVVSKQDIKDITSWAGIRNHAAHGEWDEVSDRQRITLMLEGVNLFMRNHGSH